ncbi:MAG: adenylate/guanylate cyclase domain-containing protein [Chloroflexi bacterium]|nr:adenylate/guanylate cyclase domain-containing protein [Chloroflexota bacterium]
MTEPRIQYAKTSDGVNIAYWTIGEGVPFVHMPAPYSHAELEWQMPECRRWYESLAAHRNLIRYDNRGYGLSDPDADDYSLEAHVADLAAVVDRLGLEEFALLGVIQNGPVAIAYAARYPERVSHLILWCSLIRGSDASASPQLMAARSLISENWELYTQTMAHIFFGLPSREASQRFATMMQHSVTPETHQKSRAAMMQFDVEELLPLIRSPTLVLHRRDVPYPTLDIPRELTVRIPDSRLVLLDGDVMAVYIGEMAPILDAIDDFLGDSETEEASPSRTREVHTILFTDVEGSTALTDRLGDAKARDILREHERIVRKALKEHGGSEVKTMGDGFMASFTSATGALECAIALQRAFAERNEGAQQAALLRIRIGLNAGEPIAEDDPGGRGDLFGTAVNMAARICAKAEGGEILASNVVRELVAGKGFLFSDRGETEMRGFEDPVRVYEVRWGESG